VPGAASQLADPKLFGFAGLERLRALEPAGAASTPAAASLDQLQNS
jgi:hypothetical protein